jgi:hypothetical protein
MSTLSLRLPNSLHEKIRQLSKQEGISINQFIASAAAEKGNNPEMGKKDKNSVLDDYEKLKKRNHS